MEVRALPFNSEVPGDLLLLLSEEELKDYPWPKASLKELFEAQGFTAKLGETASCVYLPEGAEKTVKVVAAGLGKGEKLTLEEVRRALGAGLKEADRLKSEVLTVLPWQNAQLPAGQAARAITEAYFLAAYRFNRYLKEQRECSVRTLQVGYLPEQEVEVIAALKVGQTLGEATNLARDLVNEPANVLTPERLAQEAQRAGEKYGFAVEVLGEEEIEKLGMEAFLAVGRASANGPRLIIMRHLGDPANPEQVLGLVGKGLTFDSGGLSLKQAKGMETMKFDMAGAAAVIGAMGALAREKVRVNVVAVVAACENLISGKGFRPGDIIGSRAGKSILVETTDAEGRLTLADAVHYMVSAEKASVVVDVATLTGAVIVALGNLTTGVLTNDQSLFERLQRASQQSGERVWQLPSFPEYREQNKTPYADLRNVGGREAGAITAGLFIGEFVEDTPWLHLDIAGTAFREKDGDYLQKGATGVGVRLLYHFAETYL
ncbi:MAG TPA: leucyl aminopeptidase [Limnochordia bacterium]|nr:leucyl aminopeptidase [Limnochordia bacterium]HOM00593.1 leucyl aminopeptidase [Limnochordia bacterium]HPP72651.1 leucyl aminopeptidase [Limnochordia bacterium]